ncbi:MAG: hypothetical protein CMM15_10180 [Rhodospirillaceae bacterium]|nr:hypothetical protein [Rhodospirillaceae bacterium]OUU21874.1 MAG: hypothetical protein CBB97_15825 [Candidatus Endolissoclinum sp. TMED37]
MIRLILLAIFIFFIIWLLRPIFKTGESNKNSAPLNKLNTTKIYGWKPIFIFLIFVTIFSILLFLFFPKFGVNLFPLFQRLLLLLSSLKSVLPF